MNKVEKIRAEVERRHKWYKDEFVKYSHPSLVVDLAAKVEETKSILSFIDSLQDKCDGCNNFKGCVTCEDGSEWAHYEEPVSNEIRRITMTKEEAIKYLQQLYPNGGHCWLDEQRLEAIGMAIKALQEESVSNNYSALLPCIYNRTLEERVKYCKYCSAACEGRVKEPLSKDLEEAANDYAHDLLHDDVYETFIAGAKWQKEQMMEDAVEVEYWDGSFFRNDLREIFQDGDKVKIIIVKDE